jgi:hypothetical protein
MQVSTDELRRLSGHNHVPEYVEYVHKNSLVNAMSVVTEIAEGLDTMSTDLEQVLIGPQPLLEDYEALGLYDDFQSDSDVDGDCNEQCVSDEDNSLDSDEINDRRCWGLVLKCYELKTRQHKMLNIKTLRPRKHYFTKDLMSFGRRLKMMNYEGLTFVVRSKIMQNKI